MSYPRETIAAVSDDGIVWALRWARSCGCRMQAGFRPEVGYAKQDLLWGLSACPEHEQEIKRVLATMSEMPPSEEEVGELFTRLLEAEIR